MILSKLKSLLTRRVENLSGSSLLQQPKPLNQCYSQIDIAQRRQGDIYPSVEFQTGALPDTPTPYWMLLNRTCQLYEQEGKGCKLYALNYAAVYPLADAILSGNSKASIKNQVSDYVNGRQEAFVFLPADPDQGIDAPLVINFNLIGTIDTNKCPIASKKCIQLSSPFSEHVFQKFSRFFYTVG